MRLAMIGTRGAPAHYGGFETCVEEVGARLAAGGHEVMVYCRSAAGPQGRQRTYRGMRLVHLPAVRQRHLETLSHTALSVGHALPRGADAVLLFNAANAPLLPLLRARRIPVATHVDGLEWKRAKWGGAGQRYYRAAESLAVRWSDVLIADAAGIATYYAERFGAPTERIGYGAPVVAPGDPATIAPLGLQPRRYHLVVARFEPENQVDVIVDGYRRSAAREPLVVVGSAPYADDYTARVQRLADERVRFFGPVWDQQVLDQLYANCLTYQHGHSVGGTNPSLLRAIGAGAATDAFDVVFNRDVLGDTGRYWTDAGDVARLIEAAEADREVTRRRGTEAAGLAGEHSWDDVAEGYESLCHRLARREVVRARRGMFAVERSEPPAPVRSA